MQEWEEATHTSYTQSHNQTHRGGFNRGHCLSLFFAPFLHGSWKLGTTASHVSVIVLWVIQHSKEKWMAASCSTDDCWMSTADLVLGFPRMATISPSALNEAYFSTTPQCSVWSQSFSGQYSNCASVYMIAVDMITGWWFLLSCCVGRVSYHVWPMCCAYTLGQEQWGTWLSTGFTSNPSC